MNGQKPTILMISAVDSNVSNIGPILKNAGYTVTTVNAQPRPVPYDIKKKWK